MKARKIIALLTVLTMCLSCVTIAFADEKFKFEETFDFSFNKTTGQGIALSSNWRSKSTDEGTMNNGTDAAPWFKVENGSLYLNTGRPRGDSMVSRWNGGDIPKTPAIVYTGDHSKLTANQKISAEIIKSHWTDSFAIGFQMSSDGKNGYIVAFGNGRENYNAPFAGGGDPIAYYIVKIQNGNYTLLKEKKVSDNNNIYVNENGTSKIDIIYEDGEISFKLDFGNWEGENQFIIEDKVTDNNPLNRAGNDGTVWLMAAGVNNADRFIQYKSVDIGSYGNPAEKGDGESGDFKYSYTKKFDDDGKVISDTCIINGLSTTPVTKTESNWELVVPDVIDGHTVTKVAANAFKENKDIYTIRFTGTHITEIGAEAFRGSDIRNFYLPEGLEKLGANTFRACYYLHELVLPSTLKSIPLGMCHIVSGYWNTENGNVTITIKAEDISFEATDGSSYFKVQKDCDFYVANKTVKDKLSPKADNDGGVYTYSYIDADMLKYSNGKVSIVPTADISGAKLVIAGYDSGKMKSLDVCDLSATAGLKSSANIDTKYTDGTYTTVKAMLINGFDKCIPITKNLVIPQ